SFFFQAEDGIRDFHVTGVQTCALPISSYSRAARAMMSRWPLVMGSNDPGQTTRRKTPPLHERSIPGGATVPNGRFTVTTDPLLRSEERRVGKERGTGAYAAAAKIRGAR